MKLNFRHISHIDQIRELRVLGCKYIFKLQGGGPINKRVLNIMKGLRKKCYQKHWSGSDANSTNRMP